MSLAFQEFGLESDDSAEERRRVVGSVVGELGGLVAGEFVGSGVGN